MPDQELTQLTAVTTLVGADLLYAVQVAGTPASYSITVANFIASAAGLTFTPGVGGQANHLELNGYTEFIPHKGNINGVVIGIGAAGVSSTLSDVIAIGFSAAGGLAASVGANQAVAICRHALYDAGGATNTIGIGHAAGQYAYAAASSVFLGPYVARNASQDPTATSFEAVGIGDSVAQWAIHIQTATLVGGHVAEVANDAIGATISGFNAGSGATTLTGAALYGQYAGSTGADASHCIYLGEYAGNTKNRPNTLIIDSNQTYNQTGTTALIYGEMDTRLLKFNGDTTFTMTVSGPTPTAAGHLATKAYVDFVGGGGGGASAPLTLTITDAGTTNVPTVETLAHDTSGAPAAGFGASLNFALQSTTTANRAAGQIISSWTDPTDATRKSRLALWANGSIGVCGAWIDVAGTNVLANGPNAALVVVGAVPVEYHASITVDGTAGLSVWQFTGSATTPQIRLRAIASGTSQYIYADAGSVGISGDLLAQFSVNVNNTLGEGLYHASGILYLRHDPANLVVAIYDGLGSDIAGLRIGSNLAAGHPHYDGATVIVQPAAAAKSALVVRGVASQSSNLEEWQASDNTVLATVSENGYFTTRKNTAPADAELVAGEAAFWFDSTNGAAKLMVKAKQADGAVKTGSITLS